jgi:hypothetical protein
VSECDIVRSLGSAGGGRRACIDRLDPPYPYRDECGRLLVSLKPFLAIMMQRNDERPLY